MATIFGHPMTVSLLAWDEKVELKIQSNDGLTFLDIAEESFMDSMASFHKVG